jgi:hypothetical protein
MLSGKVDSTAVFEPRSTINAATAASLDAYDAAMVAAASPSDSELAKKAAELAKESTALNAAAQRANNILANLPNPPTLCLTNAAHIFSESTNTDLDNDTKVRYSVKLCVILLIRIFIFLGFIEGLCLYFLGCDGAIWKRGFYGRVERSKDTPLG